MAETLVEELRFGRYSSGMRTDSGGSSRRSVWLNDLPDPLFWFPSGNLQVWLDPNDLSTMWQDSGRTTAAAVDQPVGAWNDKSGKNNHFTQATAGQRPILRQSGNYFNVDFDGADDRLFTPSNVDLSAYTALSIFFATTLDTANNGVVLDNVAYDASASGGFRNIFNLVQASAPMLTGILDGTNQSQVFETIGAPPRTNVYTILLDYAGATATDEIKFRLNGVQETLTVNIAGPCNTVSFANSALYIGTESAGLLPFDGKLWGLAIVGGVANSQQIAGMEAFMGLKIGQSF